MAPTSRRVSEEYAAEPRATLVCISRDDSEDEMDDAKTYEEAVPRPSFFFPQQPEAPLQTQASKKKSRRSPVPFAEQFGSLFCTGWGEGETYEEALTYDEVLGRHRPPPAREFYDSVVKTDKVEAVSSLAPPKELDDDDSDDEVFFLDDDDDDDDDVDLDDGRIAATPLSAVVLEDTVRQLKAQVQRLELKQQKRGPVKPILVSNNKENLIN